MYLDSKVWKKFYFDSILEYLSPNNVYPQLPNDFSNIMSPLQNILFMKFFRADIIERLIKDFMNESFKKTFLSKSYSNIEHHSLLNWFNRPTIVFYSKLNICMNNLLEMKSFRFNIKKAIARISLNNYNYKACESELEIAFKEQKWIILDTFNNLNEKNRLLLIKKINNHFSNSADNSRVRLWIFYQIKDDFFEQIKNPSFLSFLFTCFHIFFNKSITLKTTLGHFFFFDKEEYKGQISQKSQQIHMKTINKNTFASKTIKIQFHDQLFLRFTKLRKRVHSLNLHSFIDLQQLREKNSVFISLIEAGSKKIRFTIGFLMSILKERMFYEKILFPSLIIEENEFTVTGNDVGMIIEDGFQFLELFTLNPMIFLEKLLQIIFNDWSLYSNHFHEDIIRNLLRDYESSSQEKQLVITVGSFRYELLKYLPESTFEETITKTINDFPSEDPVDILGFHVNCEYQINYKRSLESMRNLREFHKFYVNLEEKCEIEDKIFDSVDQEYFSENSNLKYENVLYCLKEINYTNPLKKRIQLIENILNIVKENLSFKWCRNNSNPYFYISEETIREWFQEKIVEENLLSPFDQDDVEVITFRKLQLSLKKRNTSIKINFKKQSRVFSSSQAWMRQSSNNLKSATVVETKSRFLNSNSNNILTMSSHMKVQQQNEVYLVSI